MLVLPNVPISPVQVEVSATSLDTEVIALRSCLGLSSENKRSELVRYTLKLEEYVEELFLYAQRQIGSHDANSLKKFIESHVIFSTKIIPWSKVVLGNKETRNRKLFGRTISDSKTVLEWTLGNEVEISIVAIALVYLNLSSILVKELMEVEEVEEVANTKWKQVSSYLKKGISYLAFIERFNLMSKINVSRILCTLLSKFSLISMQMCTLCKFSWANSKQFDATESILSRNNGTLSRVAIYVVDELKGLQDIVDSLETDKDNLNLDYSGWKDYFGVIIRYTSAYSGLFLSIEYYQKDKLGDAIGLLNFSLLNLQCKNICELDEKKVNLFSKLKRKASDYKLQRYIREFQSVTTLNLDETVFKNSGLVLEDISLVFSQLIRLRVKLMKENDNIKFDDVTDWRTIHEDTKWPLGCGIPLSLLEPYEPAALKGRKNSYENSCRMAYY